MVVKLPGQSGSQEPVREFVHVRDAAPTLLELAGVAQPASPAGESGVNGIPLVKYRNRHVYPITGHSFLGELQGRHDGPLHPEPVGEEQYGRTYLRSGPWKIVWTEPPVGPLDGHWQLYDIEQDRTETTDLSAQHPDVVAELYRQYQTYMHDSGAVLAKRPGYTGSLPAPPR